ncbi:hypothetical protein FHW69_001546 [Luteibacter sp. Sphag1AF]|uniref:hypothetical protein n=1 Tax=Luteibacter sp. Sphag1AF TaxID=2587031 RepID=UPI00161C65F4|nr:hypothetical protein [Luteibacter sp. Sphag1AF]MBB3226945.1 hypothetical protein [Luteibacter sp. Sphag1AF]
MHSEKRAIPLRRSQSITDYLSRPSGQRRLVIGCGRTPEHVHMGSVEGMPCSLGQTHEHDFTVDVNPDASPDITMDIMLWRSSPLFTLGTGQFDQVTFEYLQRGPRRPFSATHIDLWIDAAHALLAPGGLLRFYSGLPAYLNAATQAMNRHGYRVQRGTIPPQGVPHNRHGHQWCEGARPR